MKKRTRLNLKGYGEVDAKILWIEGSLVKIEFITHSGMIKFLSVATKRSEVFHFKEILNYNDIFIDKDLNISDYERD